MTAAESALRAQRFTTRVAARTGEWKTTRRPPVAWAALVSAVYAVLLPGSRKAAAGVGHGAAHLLQHVADARKHPCARAVQEQGGGDGEQGATAALARLTTNTEENDSSFRHCISELTEHDSNSVQQVFDEMIWYEEKISWSWDLVR